MLMHYYTQFILVKNMPPHFLPAEQRGKIGRHPTETKCNLPHSNFSGNDFNNFHFFGGISNDKKIYFYCQTPDLGQDQCPGPNFSTELFFNQIFLTLFFGTYFLVLRFIRVGRSSYQTIFLGNNRLFRME